MMLLARAILLVAVLGGGQLLAQIAGPSPLVLADPPVAIGGSQLVRERWADQALENGFPVTAAAIYQELARDTALPVEARQRATLALVTAWLAAGEIDQAESVLAGYDGPRTTAYELRAGLLALHAHRIAPVRSALAAGKPEELPAADRGWWFFLQAGVAEAEGNSTQANAFYDQAARSAVSDLQRARFVLAQEQARLRNAPTNEEQIAALRANMERFPGSRTGFDFARAYAASLAMSDRSAEAQEVLRRQLSLVPPSERNIADQLRLLLGLVAGERSRTGRQAFWQLVREAGRPETQRVALQLLARGATTDADRSQLRRDLGELIGANVTHPIIEDLLLARAQAALAEKAYPAAEEDARVLIERYPASGLRSAALSVRLAVAWELKRYRAVADLVTQLRATLPPSRDRAELGVLLGEAYFRAEDFRNAADAYEAVLHEAPLAAPAGVLIFQRVLAEIRADRLDAAASQLDAAAADAAFDAVSRWQAEWNLVKEMQVRGLTQAASDRVERLLGGNRAGVPPELAIRLQWLRAKLSFDNGQPEAALRQADELLAGVGSAPLGDNLRLAVTSTGRLLKAQALLAAGRAADGLRELDQLRTEYRGTPSAQYSYLIQAGYLGQQGDLAGAQQLLIDFVDRKEYRQSEYAPLALYQAALLLERQGLDRQLQEAYKLLERLLHDYPRDDLVFSARMKQGDIFRKLNDFSAARQVYEYLVNNFPGHPDELLAQLALADSLFAQGANSVANYESAAAIFERLRDLPSAPVDLRVEAGFKWGYALAKRSQPAKAQTVFWSVIETFLLDSQQAAKLGANGRWWISKSILELAQLHEEAGRNDEAQRAYQLIITNRLNGMALAQAKLARFRAPAEPAR